MELFLLKQILKVIPSSIDTLNKSIVVKYSHKLDNVHRVARKKVVKLGLPSNCAFHNPTYTKILRRIITNHIKQNVLRLAEHF